MSDESRFLPAAWPSIHVCTFEVFEELNPTEAKKFRDAGWTGPIIIRDGIAEPLMDESQVP